MRGRAALALAAVALTTISCSPPPTAEDFETSVFRVRGEGCRVANIGTAFAVGPNLLLTNAHVVAGVTSGLVVTAAHGESAPASLVAFDPVNDFALLDVAGLDAEPLDLGPAIEGSAVLVDARIEGELALIDVEVVRLVDIEIGDIYDEGSYLRMGLEATGDIGPGTSGAPVIVRNVVVGAVFAETRDGGVVFATSSDEIEAFLDLPRSEIELPTGRCRR